MKIGFEFETRLLFRPFCWLFGHIFSYTGYCSSSNSLEDHYECELCTKEIHVKITNHNELKERNYGDLLCPGRLRLKYKKRLVVIKKQLKWVDVQQE